MQSTRTPNAIDAPIGLSHDTVIKLCDFDFSGPEWVLSRRQHPFESACVLFNFCESIEGEDVSFDICWAEACAKEGTLCLEDLQQSLFPI